MTAFPKQIREVNEPFKKFVESQECCCIGLKSPCLVGDIVAHHIKTRGSGGGDSGNMIPVCINHNDLAHRGFIPKKWQKEQAQRYYDKYLEMKKQF